MRCLIFGWRFLECLTYLCCKWVEDCPSYMYGLSRNLLSVLVINFKLGYISFRVVVGCAVLQYCTSRWGIVFLDHTFKASAWMPHPHTMVDDVDVVIYITKKEHVNILLNHINNMDDHIKFTMEWPDNKGSIPYLDTMCTPNHNHTIHTIVYRKPIHTQTDIWIGSPTTQYLQKGLLFKHSPIQPRRYAPLRASSQGDGLT